MEKATAVNTCLGVLKGRDCIYLDQVKQDALNNLTVKAGDKKLNLPTVEGGKVEAYADYEQIIDTDGTIYQPLEDKTVSVEFKVTDQNTKFNLICKKTQIKNKIKKQIA